MRKILLTGLLLPLSLASMAATQDVTLFGQLYTGSEDNSIYSFSSGTDAAMEKVAELYAVPNCGSVKTPDRFYCFSQEAGDYGAEYKVHVYDSSDGYRLVTSIGSAYSIARPGQVLAYDPVTKKIYSVFQESGYYGSEYYLGEVNISNRTMTKIGSSLYFGYGSTSIVAMAFNPEGELYGIASNSTLYKINTTNADLTYIGSTGIYPEYEQSMAFSPDGSEIFWAACNDDITALYSVDPATGKATKIKDFPAEQEFVSLWVGDIEAAPGAPAAPTSLTAEFENGSLSGTVTFTAPLLTHSGDPLEGEISYTITADDLTVGQGTTTPGAVTPCPVTVSEAGTYELKVTLSNAEGQGDSATLPAIYIGNDVPMYVSNLAMAPGDEPDSYVVSWDAPTEGAHGGYVDPSLVKYRLRRLPSFDILSEDATSPYTDRFTSDQPVKCSYEVTPYIDDNTVGLPLTTPFIMVGTPYDTPYLSDFSTPAGANLWTVVDGNDDGHSWEYQWDFGYYRIYDNNNPKDDWLISPYIKLDAGYSYRLTYKVRTIATEEMEVKMGLGLTAGQMTIQLSDKETIPDTDYDWVDRSRDFDCTSSGNYHIGFHAMSADPENALALYIKDVKVEQTGSSGVAQVALTEGKSDFVVTDGTVTALRATTVEVITIDGRTAAKATLQPGECLQLPAGLHIITSTNGQTVKAATR